MNRQKDTSGVETLEQRRVNFARRILIWSCVTMAFMASFLSMVLVFLIGSDPAQIIPVTTLSFLFLIFPLLLRVGVSFSVVRIAFFACALGSILMLSLHPRSGIILGYMSYLPIFIALSGMLYSTRGVVIVTAFSALVVLLATVYSVTVSPILMSLEGPEMLMPVAARHLAGIMFAAILVVVAMSIFKELLERLRQALEREQTLSEAKTEFLAAMSHEVRTPLNAIIGMAEILRTRPLPDEDRKQIDTIAEAGHALMEMLNQVLDIARLDSYQMEVEPEPTEMPLFFEGFLRLWGPIAENKKLKFRMEIDPSMPDFLEVDGMRLRQCVNNLLSNAIKFTEEGFILLAARWDVRPGSPSRLVIEITDTGIGMPPEAAQKVFAPFEQADRRIERAYGGSGLGLSITRNLARLMGGDLTFKSVAGEGSIFSLSILGVEIEEPSDRGEEDTVSANANMLPYSLMHAESEADDGADNGTNIMAPFKALVADDLATNRFIAVSYLRTLGVDTIEAENGADAVRMVLEDPDINLVLLDRHMPQTDGLWALRELKSLSQTKDIPVVIFTAGLSDQDMRLCRSEGARDVLIKPFTIVRLRELVDVLKAENAVACAENGQ